MAHGATEERRTNRGPAARRRRPRMRSLPVGAMILMGGLAIAGALLWIDDRQHLFAPTFEVYADFTRLDSIRRGAAVHVAGAAAGEVSGIRLPRSPAEKFRLTLRIREPFHGLVRTDSLVSLQSVGAVGTKIVQIEPGLDAAPQAPPGSTLAVAEDNDAADPLTRARSILMSVDTALETARAKLEQFNSRTGGDSTPRNPKLPREIAPAVNDLAAKLSDVRAGRGALGKLLMTEELHGRATRMLEDAQANLSRLNTRLDKPATERSARAGSREAEGSGESSPLASVSTPLDSFSAGTERLKRNFFFRGFFEGRGYYDLDAISPDEYRKGALESGNRRAVRIWIRHDVLFANSDGQERLTPEGASRLESAMSELLKLPPDSPIVVEGFAADGGYEDRIIASTRRAELARAHLVSRFGLTPSRVGAVGLGAFAPDSPAQGSWDGVAIAIFLRIADGL